MHARRQMVLFLVAACAGTKVGAQRTGEWPAGWPDRVVRIEVLRPVSKLNASSPVSVVDGDITKASVLRAYVSHEGAVIDVGLMESCGNADYDEAALRGLQEMRFQPFTIGGQAIAITLVVPVHFPKRKIHRGKW